MQSDDARKRLGGAVKALRESQGWSQTDLANRLGRQIDKAVDPTTITRMERGTRPTTVDELFALSVVFAVAPERLLDSAERISEFAKLKTLVNEISALTARIAADELKRDNALAELEKILKKSPELERELPQKDRETLFKVRAPF